MSRKMIYLDDAINAVKAGTFGAATLFGRTDEGMTALAETVRLIKDLPSAQPEAKTNANGDWVILNKDKILKAGMEGREVEFRIGGRLFAIREKAQ